MPSSSARSRIRSSRRRYSGRSAPSAVNAELCHGWALRIALRAAALEVDREGQQAVPAPLRHGRHELARVAVRVPGARVRVGPPATRLGVQVVEDALHHARVQQQAFQRVAAPLPAREVGRPLMRKLSPSIATAVARVPGGAVETLGRHTRIESGCGKAGGDDEAATEQAGERHGALS